MRAQVSLEYLIITGMVLALIIPIIYLSASTGMETRHNTLRSEVQKLGNAIELVYAQGFPARDSVWLGMPADFDTSETYVGNGTVKVAVLEGDDRIDIIATISSDICILGDIPEETGYHHIIVSMYEGCVLLREEGESEVMLSPGYLHVTLGTTPYQGDEEYVNITIINFGESGITGNLTLETIGGNTDLNASTPGIENEITGIYVGAEEEVRIEVRFFAQANEEGTRSGKIVFSNNVSDEMEVTIQITKTTPKVLNILTYNDSSYAFAKRLFVRGSAMFYQVMSFPNISVNVTAESLDTSHNKISMTDGTGRLNESFFLLATDPLGHWNLTAEWNNSTDSTCFETVKDTGHRMDMGLQSTYPPSGTGSVQVYPISQENASMEPPITDLYLEVVASKMVGSKTYYDDSTCPGGVDECSDTADLPSQIIVNSAGTWSHTFGQKNPGSEIREWDIALFASNTAVSLRTASVSLRTALGVTIKTCDYSIPGQTTYDRIWICSSENRGLQDTGELPMSPANITGDGLNGTDYQLQIRSFSNKLTLRASATYYLRIVNLSSRLVYRYAYGNETLDLIGGNVTQIGTGFNFSFNSSEPAFSPENYIFAEVRYGNLSTGNSRSFAINSSAIEREYSINISNPDLPNAYCLGSLTVNVTVFNQTGGSMVGLSPKLSLFNESNASIVSEQVMSENLIERSYGLTIPSGTLEENATYYLKIWTDRLQVEQTLNGVMQEERCRGA